MVVLMVIEICLLTASITLEAVAMYSKHKNRRS
jgi:hypothetical protein